MGFRELNADELRQMDASQYDHLHFDCLCGKSGRINLAGWGDEVDPDVTCEDCGRTYQLTVQVRERQPDAEQD